MSEYSDLKVLVGDIAAESQNMSLALTNYSQTIARNKSFFYTLVATTRDSSAKEVFDCFSVAEKKIQFAAEVLNEAAEAGFRWCDEAPPQLKLVLKRR